MKDIYITGGAMTPFGRHAGVLAPELAQQAIVRAMDDAGGSVAAWEAVRLMHVLGLRPRRTVRVVLWTNEENGLRGATAYRDAHIDEIDKHVLAIESDNGVIKPLGYYIAGSDAALETAERRLIEYANPVSGPTAFAHTLPISM